MQLLTVMAVMWCTITMLRAGSGCVGEVWLELEILLLLLMHGATWPHLVMGVWPSLLTYP